MKKPHDDDVHLQLTTPHQKRISMIHHMPLDESLEHADLKVHIPGGGTEEIIIHTDFAPPTPRLSMSEEQLINMPVIYFCLIENCILFYLFFYRFKILINKCQWLYNN
jgi:hypothetical protein